MLHAVKCTNCNGYNTVTHYFHIPVAGDPHNFDIPNPPPPAPEGTPVPQPCPIDGCYNTSSKGNPVFSYCLDCGTLL